YPKTPWLASNFGHDFHLPALCELLDSLRRDEPTPQNHYRGWLCRLSFSDVRLDVHALRTSDHRNRSEELSAVALRFRFSGASVLHFPQEGLTTDPGQDPIPWQHRIGGVTIFTANDI